MESSGNRLGDYLRARRELVKPEDVGLPSGGRRRVPGLRREELAMLAGISSDYYLRLEQGRDLHPSAQVLNAIGRALRLDADATAYLHQLAGPVSRRRTPSRPARVPATILQLIASWTTTPAYVQNAFTDILAVNRLAQALSPNYSPGVNLLRAAFLDPSDRRLRRDWEQATEEGVATLRGLVGPDVDNPRLIELVGELSVRSEWFRQLWARHDVQPKRGRLSLLDHPQVGPLELYGEKLSIAGSDNLMLVVFQAEPGSRSAESLALLASLAATEDASEDASGDIAGAVVTGDSTEGSTGDMNEEVDGPTPRDRWQDPVDER
ncbi:helix-turn-helix domain-containing protein [Micromonospora sp. NPDC050397]|uniref:helix-turn-helix domain-containing protein n=1 Tax=Micromonospora sp. NPDC050397 TaxID=3364279 RepID=UPI00384D2B14